MTSADANRIASRIMLGLALFALLLVGGATVLLLLGRFTPSPDGDEGTAAHLFQLSIVLLVPTGLAFLATADWRRPRQVVTRLLPPAVALAVAFTVLYYMEHAR